MFESCHKQTWISAIQSNFKFFYEKCQTTLSKIKITVVDFHDMSSVKIYLNPKTRFLVSILGAYSKFITLNHHVLKIVANAQSPQNNKTAPSACTKQLKRKQKKNAQTA